MREFLDLIPSPNRERCLALWSDNEERFRIAWGSSHNHQAWPGGYLDHVHETMRVASLLYGSLTLLRGLPFSLPDALLILFLHDLEKPWKSELRLGDKADKRAFRDAEISAYGIELTLTHINALRYVEGEGDDYRSDRRVMNELAAFCHCCDVVSARIWHDQPKFDPADLG